MNRRAGANLVEVTHALYLRELRGTSGILAQEAALRRDLARLDQQADSARAELPTDAAMQATGAGILWRGWVDRTRRDLNTDLARVLARKHVALDAVRLAHGREQALRNLFDADVATRRAKAARRIQENPHVSTISPE